MTEQITPSLSQNEAALRRLLDSCGDVLFRPLALDGSPPMRALLVYCTSVFDARFLDEQALAAILLQLHQGLHSTPAAPEPPDLAALVGRRSLPLGTPHPVLTVQDCMEMILTGHLALLVDGCSGALLFRVLSNVGRSVTEPVVEGVIRGPREGLVEQLDTNITLVRRRLQTPAFRLERSWVGARTRTEVAMLWLDGVVSPRVVARVRRRLRRVKLDGVLDSAYLEEFMEDARLSPFPTIGHTERPDRVAAGLLEGQVALIVAGSPQALILPITFMQLLHSPEDYYERFYAGTLLRALRVLAAFLALTLPSLYVAVTTYHHEMIPSALFQALASQREGVPWPAVMEAFLMEIAFELLREAGIRLPRPVGQAVSIIGGLVIGEAAIRARIASAGMIIIVATTGIASYAVPAYSLSISLRLIRFVLMALAGTLGLHGVVVGLLLVLIHLLGLRSFGVPYLSPVSPLRLAHWRDALLRAPWWHMRRHL
ncbi:MAG TPA: spore germination protein [Symbiobacteriaceae bacterium]|nr:spore germination protein [Symbiobacteriaceae bacterium]